MSRMIDADALIKKFQSDKEYFDKVGDTTFAMAAIGVIHDIEDAPTIDAVSVVRCKDCMFSKVYQNDSSGVMGRFCEAFTQVRMVTDDDYCSYGERKEKDNE